METIASECGVPKDMVIPELGSTAAFAITATAMKVHDNSRKSFISAVNRATDEDAWKKVHDLLDIAPVHLHRCEGLDYAMFYLYTLWIYGSCVEYGN